MRYLRIISAYMLWLVVLAACTSTPTHLPDLTATRSSSAEGNLPELLSTPDQLQNKMTQIAIADLAFRLSLDFKSIRVISAEPTLWPDTALGCPRPGEVYAQQTVPGYRVRLEANPQEYVYHTDMDQTAILCTEEDLPSFPVTPGEIDDGQPWMPVD